MGHKKIVINATLLDPMQRTVVKNQALLIEKGRIVETGQGPQLLKHNRDATVTDVNHKIVMPGLINAHTHLYSTFACGITAEPARNFPEILRKLWWKLDRSLSLDDVYYSALISMYRAIISGTTILIDHHASPFAVDKSLDVLREAAHAAGLRTSLCYEVSDRDGPEIAKAGIRENVRFAKTCVETAENMVKPLFGLHASMTLSRKTLEECVSQARQLGIGLHVHAAEDDCDQDDCISKYGQRVIERFQAAGALGPKCILAHCIHVQPAEIRLLAQTSTFVAHNPQSNMNNSVGVADILTMLRTGVCVGLGTDGMTSDMREEARIAMLLQHHYQKDPRVGFVEAVDILCSNNARFASSLFGLPLGTLVPGAAADLIVVEHYPFTSIDSNNWYGHFLFGIQPARVTHTMVNGRWLMVEGEVITLNYKDIALQAQSLSSATWERFASMEEHKL